MKIAITLLVCLLTSCTPTSKNFKSTGFIWFDSTLNNMKVEKSSMHIPVLFENDDKTYYFQFDTGANKSYLYTGPNSDKGLLKRIKTKVHLSTSIGDIVLNPAKSNSTYIKDNKTFIGTIGSDILQNSIVEIDFLNQGLAVLKEYDSKEYSMQSMSLTKGRPIIQLNIQGENHTFLFDTGSSMFDIWTSKQLWEKWREQKSEINAFPISSWGKINNAYRADISEIPANNLFGQNIEFVWYNSKKSFENTFKNAGVSGVIGNRPFLKHKLLLDFKNKLIGLKK